MKATLLFKKHIRFEDGAILEATIWEVPKPVKASKHNYKYSLFYGYPNQRLICYDNERGKGDHRHYGSIEEAYELTDLEKLWSDFSDDVEKERTKT